MEILHIFALFLQASGTVHRLREGEEELLKVSSLPQTCFCESYLISEVFTPGGSGGRKGSEAHML